MPVIVPFQKEGLYILPISLNYALQIIPLGTLHPTIVATAQGITGETMALYDLTTASLITIFAYFLIFVPGYISEMCDEKLFLISS